MWKVAIVDDEPATRDGLLRHMPWQGLGIAEVRAAADAGEMLALCEAMQPDIVISDVRMPGMDGIALCRQLRALYPKCRIIFLSGYSDKEYLLSAIEISAVSYVEKPVDIDELTRVLSRAVAECEELREREHAILEPAVFAQFVAAQAGGSRDEVLKAADTIYASIQTHQVTSLQALRTLYFQLSFQLAQRSQSAANTGVLADELHAALEQCTDAQALHSDLIVRIDDAFPVGYEGMTLSLPVRQVIRLMKADLGNAEMTIDTLAKQVYLSPTYLANLFKKETGQTIGQFLLDLRMQRARELLKDGMLRLYQVAQKVGYTDPNYFAKMFRKTFGMTPKAYREKM